MAKEIFKLVRAGAVESLRSNIVEPVVDTLWGETGRGLTRVIKLMAADHLFGLKGTLTQSFARLEDARPKPDFGYSSEGIMDVFMAFIYASTILSIVIGDELAQELYSEMIQEGISNAIQTSYGGTLQTIFNVYRGGTPINPDDIRDAYNIKELIDEKIQALNIASAGNNLYATLYYMIAGGYNQIQQNYMTVLNQIQQMALRVLENAMYPHEYIVTLMRVRLQERLHSIMEAYDYLISLATATAESVIARFNDYRTSIKSILEETYITNPLTTEEECKAVVEGNVRSALTTYNNYREVYQRIEDELNNIEITVPPEEIQEYKEAIINYAKAVKEMFDAVNNQFIADLNDLISWANTIRQMILAYRQKYKTAPIEGVPIEEILEPDYITKTSKYYRLEVIVYGE